MPKLRGATSRHDIARTPQPASGYVLPPSSPMNTLATLCLVAISDPYDERRRVRAIARIDLLDRERRARRIDEASYRVGSEVEDMFETMSRIGGGGQWLEGDRIDAASTAELAIVLGVEHARAVNAFLGWLVHHLGRRDTRLLWDVLGNRQSFTGAATARGYLGSRGVHYVTDRFRDALSELAEVKAATGTGSRSGGQPLRRGVAVVAS